MTKFLKMGAVSLIGLGALSFSNASNAHHSFAIYDLDNPIIITGVLESLEFRNPHTIVVVNDVAIEGSWTIESMAPTRWDNVIGNRDIADVGDTVTIRGWPAVNGGLTMALGTITSSKGVTLVREEITQNKPVESDEERARLEEITRTGEGGGMGGGGMGDGGGMGGMGDGGGGMGGGMGDAAARGDGSGGMGGGMADGGMGGEPPQPQPEQQAAIPAPSAPIAAAIPQAAPQAAPEPQVQQPEVQQEARSDSSAPALPKSVDDVTSGLTEKAEQLAENSTEKLSEIASSVPVPASVTDITDGVAAASSGSKSIWGILGALLLLALGGFAFAKSRKS